MKRLPKFKEINESQSINEANTSTHDTISGVIDHLESTAAKINTSPAPKPNFKSLSGKLSSASYAIAVRQSNAYNKNLSKKLRSMATKLDNYRFDNRKHSVDSVDIVSNFNRVDSFLKSALDDIDTKPPGLQYDLQNGGDHFFVVKGYLMASGDELISRLSGRNDVVVYNNSWVARSKPQELNARRSGKLCVYIGDTEYRNDTHSVRVHIVSFMANNPKVTDY